VGNPTTGSAHQVSDTYLDSSDSKVKKISQYDLAALGYQIVDEPNTSTNGYVEPDQVVTGFFKTLIEKVDTNDSKELEASEIRAAQRDPALQSTLGKIVGGHPSEWHSSTQQNIKILFETKKATCTDTAHKNLLDFEKSRLQSCEFMSQVPLAQKVWHFHPGWLCFYMKNKNWMDNDRFVNIYKEQHHDASKFGTYDRNVKINTVRLNSKSESNLRDLLSEMEKQYYKYFDKFNEKYIAYMLSTIRIESYKYWNPIEYFRPIAEQISYADAEKNYGCGETASIQNRQRAVANENNSVGDGFEYRGRGLVQLTWKINYRL